MKKYYGIWNICYGGGWMKKVNGKIIFYPSLAIAQAHAKDLNEIDLSNGADGKDYEAREIILEPIL